MENINVITIEKNIPIPELTWSKACLDKYNFVEMMEIGDSFKVNGNTPNFTPSAIRAYIYGLNSKKIPTEIPPKKFTIRTLEGHSKHPTAIRVWRVR